MRAVTVDKMKVKFFLVINTADVSALAIREICDEYLVLDQAVAKNVLDNIQEVVVGFMVSGKWKKYRLTDLRWSEESKTAGGYSVINFSIDENLRYEFKRDFSSARIR